MDLAVVTYTVSLSLGAVAAAWAGLRIARRRPDDPHARHLPAVARRRRPVDPHQPVPPVPPQSWTSPAIGV